MYLNVGIHERVVKQFNFYIPFRVRVPIEFISYTTGVKFDMNIFN